MTAQNKNSSEVEKDDRLEGILQTVKSIDRNVEEILDKLADRFDSEVYEPHWDEEDFFNGNGKEY
jgi:hypothetical protein